MLLPDDEVFEEELCTDEAAEDVTTATLEVAGTLVLVTAAALVDVKPELV